MADANFGVLQSSEITILSNAPGRGGEIYSIREERTELRFHEQFLNSNVSLKIDET